MRKLVLTAGQCSRAAFSCRHIRPHAAAIRSYATREDSDNITLQQDVVTIPFHNLQGTTITPKERNVFQRLFQNVIRDAAAKKPAPKSKKDSAAQADGADGEQLRSREELVDSVSKFPHALRDIALSTAEQIERDAWEAAQRAKYDAENATLALSREARIRAEQAKLYQEAELGRLTNLIENAPTDFAVWNILETELFKKLAGLELDQIVAKHSAVESMTLTSKESSEENATMSSQLFTEISNLGVLYPATLNQAIFTWRKRFPSSTMPFSVLPRMRQIGKASYALGASSTLYHQLIEFTWTMTGDFAQVTTLLEEMDEEGFDFTTETMSLVRKIQKSWEGRLKPAKSKLEAMVLRLGTTREEYIKFRNWGKVIVDRLDMQALRQANEKIAQHKA